MPSTVSVSRYISIHAPLAESDPILRTMHRSAFYFNPRSPCGERLLSRHRTPPLSHFNPRSPCGERRGLVFVFLVIFAFQSTLPLRRATPHFGTRRQMVGDFNPRSPCGERLTLLRAPLRPSQFQSTLPLRRATRTNQRTSGRTAFQSTLPLRRATSCRFYAAGLVLDFNPRSPCGERLHSDSG